MRSTQPPEKSWPIVLSDLRPQASWFKARGGVDFVVVAGVMGHGSSITSSSPDIEATFSHTHRHSKVALEPHWPTCGTDGHCIARRTVYRLRPPTVHQGHNDMTRGRTKRATTVRFCIRHPTGLAVDSSSRPTLTATSTPHPTLYTTLYITP